MLTGKGKGSILPVTAEAIPGELRALPQWVLWRPETRKGKLTKVPYQVNGRRAKSDAPETWSPFDAAWAAYQAGRADGIGFVFAPGGGLCGVDLDDCVGEAGAPHPKAEAIVRALDSYTERSVSGRGLHVIVRARLDAGRRRGPLEIYGGRRYFCFTGRVWGERRDVREAQAEIDRLVAGMSGPPKRGPRGIATGGGYLSNVELVEKAKAARNGAKFARLWDGDISDYPSQSEADLALMCLLLFWTRGDADRAEALFSQSGLAREKWARPDYRARTLRAAAECLKGGGAHV